MVSYEFYKDVYMGSLIPSSAFDFAIGRAEEWLRWLERTCTVTATGPDSRKLALCAMAETFHRFRKRDRIVQESVGGVSIRYESAGSLNKELLSCVKIYLQVGRGVA